MKMTLKAAERVANLAALGLNPEVVAANDEQTRSALAVIAEHAAKAAAPKVAALNERADEALTHLRWAVGFDVTAEAGLLGVTVSDLRTTAPAVAEVLDLLATLKPASTPRGSGDGARAHVEWAVLAGQPSKWLALRGRGKDARLAQSGSVFFIEPPATSDEVGRVTWRTTSLKSETRSLSKALSTNGRLRPTDAGLVAIYSAYGLLTEFASARSTKDEVVSESDLLATAKASDVQYLDLGDLGDPATMSNDELEKAFAKRDDLTAFITL